MVDCLLGDNSYTIVRPKFRQWMELEGVHKELSEAIDRRNLFLIGDLISSYVSIAINEDKNIISEEPWYQAAEILVEQVNLSIPRIRFPILLGEDKDKTVDPWDYSGRDLYYWYHLLSSTYGWNLEYIDEMAFESVIALIQEITTNSQLEKEWEWSLSDRAFTYNKVTEKYDYNPLSRPRWMKQKPTKIGPPKKIKIPRNMIPAGIVVKMDDDENTKYAGSSGALHALASSSPKP